MLVELAVGDAYGACFEGMDTEIILKEHNNLEYHNLLPALVKSGCYTDDTQMTLAIAEAVLEDGPWTKEALADRFVKCFHRDERRGYTSAFLIFLMNSQTGKELLSRIDGRSTKSGAAMRAGPIGLYKNLKEVIEKSKIQAEVTHDSILGRASALCAAAMVHYFVYDLGPKAELCDWLKKEFFGDMLHNPKSFRVPDSQEIRSCWRPDQDRPVRCDGWECVEAALYAIETQNTLGDVLKTAVGYGGDTDTVATIAMAAASWSKEIKQNLPAHLMRNLEQGRYGLPYLAELDYKLRQKFNL